MLSGSLLDISQINIFLINRRLKKMDNFGEPDTPLLFIEIGRV